MKSKTATIFSVLLIGLSLGQAAWAGARKINVMTFNVHYGVNAKESNLGSDSALDQLAAYIKDNHIDVAFVQEFPHANSHTHFKFTGERANHRAFIESLLPKEYTIFEEVVRDGTKYRWGKSQLIITRLPVVGGPYVKDFPTPMNNMTRQIALLKVKVDGKLLWVGNTHPWHKHDGLNDKDLDTVAQFLKATIPATDAIVWGGDLNFDSRKYPDKHKKFTRLGFKDSYAAAKGKYATEELYNTFVNRKPGTSRIDYLFHRNIASCENYWRGESGKSDHYAVFATFVLDGGE